MGHQSEAEQQQLQDTQVVPLMAPPHDKPRPSKGRVAQEGSAS